MKALYTSFVALALFLGACKSEPKTTSKKSSMSVQDSADIALKELDAQLRANPSDAELYVRRAKVQQIKGNYQAAYVDALQAIGLDSLNPLTWYEFGRASFAVDNFYRAEDAYRRCIVLDHDNTDCMVKLAEFYLIRKKYDQAMEFCNMALKKNDQQARPYFIKGWIYEEKGDTANASTSYQTSVELDPNNYEAYIKLGLLAVKSRKGVSIDYFNSAIAARPRSLDAYYYKAMYLQDKERYDEAITVYKQIMGIDSSYAYSYYNMGYIKLTVENQADTALILFNKAIKHNPTYAEAYFNRGYCKEILGKSALAATDYQQCLTLNPNYLPAKEALKRVQ